MRIRRSTKKKIAKILGTIFILLYGFLLTSLEIQKKKNKDASELLVASLISEVELLEKIIKKLEKQNFVIPE